MMLVGRMSRHEVNILSRVVGLSFLETAWLFLRCLFVNDGFICDLLMTLLLILSCIDDHAPAMVNKLLDCLTCCGVPEASLSVCLLIGG